MAFRFSLQSVLRIRETLERVELQKLQALIAQANAARAEIEALARDRENSWRALQQAAVGGVSGVELQVETQREQARAVRRQELARKLTAAEQAERQQLARYRQARQQREILSTLRENQLAAYNLEESRRQQQVLDELFLLRHNPARSTE
jgi:flagellar export protein FliJ